MGVEELKAYTVTCDFCPTQTRIEVQANLGDIIENHLPTGWVAHRSAECFLLRCPTCQEHYYQHLVAQTKPLSDQRDDNPIATCAKCGTLSDLQTAINRGWFPSIRLRNGEQADACLCLNCGVAFLDHALVLVPGLKLKDGVIVGSPTRLTD